MDVKGARALAQRIGSNPVPARPAPADLPAGSLPLYNWVGGGSNAAYASEPIPSASRPRLRGRRLRER